MNTLDLIILIPILYAIYKGYRKGIIRTVLSVLVWVFGWMIASKLSSTVATSLGPDLQNSKFAPILAFVIVLSAITIVVHYLGKFMDKMLKTVMLGWTNRISGALVYGFMAAILASGLLWLIDSLGMTESSKDDSTLYGYVQPLAPAFAKNTETLFPILESSYTQISDILNNNLDKITTENTEE